MTQDTLFNDDLLWFHKKLTLVEVQELIEKSRINIHAVDSCHNNALHCIDNVKIAELLIQNGVDFKLRNHSGHTPLHLATTVEMAELFLNHGEYVNVVDSESNTPLHLTDNVKIAELLIRHGANVNALNSTRSTPLHLAYNIEKATLLINHNVDVNARNIYDFTPLAYSSSFEEMELLINHGADINCQPGGTIPCKVIQDYKAMELFIKNGANVNAVGISGYNIFTIAFGFYALHQHGSDKLIKLMINNGAVPCSKDCYLCFYNLFTKEQQNAFDAFSLLTNDNDEFFKMCLAYQNDHKNHVQIDIKEMDIL